MEAEPQRDSIATQLLQQEAWLRRLARGLVGRTDEVDDLTQEVLLAALRDGPRGRGGALRAWLGTVARRTAARTGRRERARLAHETHAARRSPREMSEGEGAHAVDAVDAEALASQRLALQRRLLECVQGLGPDPRTAIVLRYFEECSSSEMAQRLGITPEAARQRVARGLAQLRTQFLREVGERPDWTRAFALLALRAPAERGLPSTSIVAATPLGLVLLTMKTLAVVTSLSVVCLCAWLFSRQPIAAPTDLPVVTKNDTSVDVLVDGQAPIRDVSLVEPAALDQRTRVSSPATKEGVAKDKGRRLRVVGEDELPVAGAHAAWVDAEGTVRELELDVDGTAPLPEGDGVGRVFATAPHYSTQRAELATRREDQDLLLKLLRPVSLRGRVVMDGIAPAEPLTLVLFPYQTLLHTAGPWAQRATTQLEELGFGEARGTVAASASGDFQFEGVHPLGRGNIWLPGSYRTVGNSSVNIRYSLPLSGPLVVALQRLPYVSGRVLWADDGTPVEGPAMATLTRSDDGTSMSLGLQVSASGKFEVALRGESSAVVTLHQRLALKVEPLHGAAREHEYSIELFGATLPFDLGTLRLERATTVRVRLMAADGTPITDAVVVGDGEGQLADPSGVFELPTPSGGWLDVLAPGYALTSVEVAAAERDVDGVTVVRLEGGHALRVRLTGLEIPEGQQRPRLVVEWDEDPFEALLGSAERAARARRKLIIVAAGETFFTSKSSTRNDSGGLELDWQGDAPLTIGGLRAGARLRVGLASALRDRPVAITQFEVTQQPSVIELELTPTPAETCLLELSAVDEGGAALAGARFGVVDENGEVSGDLRSTAWPLPAGRLPVLVSAPARIPRTVELDVAPNMAPVAVALDPARIVRVEVRDDVGLIEAPAWAFVSVAGTRVGVKCKAGVGMFDAAPLGEGEIEVELAGRTWSVPLAADTSEVVVQVPCLGTLRVSIDTLPVPSDVWAEWSVLVPISGETPGVVESSFAYTSEARGPAAIDLSLLPGRVAFTVRGRDGTGGPAVWRELWRAEADIVAGRVIEVTGPSAAQGR